VKTGAQFYQEDVLQGVLKPPNMTVLNIQKWVFQQDSAPAHKTKTTQEWLRRKVPAFNGAEVWPSGSKDLTACTLTVGCFGGYGCRKRHNNSDKLKRCILKAAADIPLEMGRYALAEWPERLKACFGAEGGHFRVTLL